MIILLAATLLSVDPRPLTTFDPRTAFGAAVDVLGDGESAKVHTKPNIDAMLSAGFQRLSYRLATELGGEAWHWNPRGTWSDAAHQQGYWTSNDRSDVAIDASYGYRLPRRGNTIDQSGNNSYSRIDDGDVSTFWKSNPFLAGRPQWLFVDLGEVKPLRTIRILWGEPYGVDFRVQRWSGEDPINSPAGGRWIDLPRAIVRGNSATETKLKLESTARYVRVLMTRSSHRAPRGATDPRDREGFAVRELWIDDYVRHAPSRKEQSIVWVSSTDPWHRAIDIDRSMEQPGLDLVFRSGLTRGLPVLTPVALLYCTPEDSAAELRFLRARGYAVSQIEMGEEPDGQSISPEDYATLYERWADALHEVDPTIALGGPAFQSTVDTVAFWPDEHGRTSWIGRFLDVLRARGRVRDFAFFSFEWYPFDDACLPPHPQLVSAPALLRRVLDGWHAEGLPRDVPMVASEYGWSSFAAEPEVRMEAALFNTEFVAEFLSLGGAAAYFFGLEPDVLRHELPCPSWGNLMLLMSDDHFRIRYRLPAYWAARLMTRVWCMSSGPHTLHVVHGTSTELRAFAVTRPDGSRAMLIINKDPARATRVLSFDGELDVDQYSGAQYQWIADGKNGRPRRDEPPQHFHAHGEVDVPPYSLTVITSR